MSLFKHATVQGINEYLERAGIVAWPNEKVAEEICLKVAAEMQGPDMLPEGGLSPSSALTIGQVLKSASDELAAMGYKPEPAHLLLRKQAASADVVDVALVKAAACMDYAAALNKRAEDGSLTSVGENTPESAATSDQHAALDQKERPQGEYLVGVGNTELPDGGVSTGREMPHPEAPADSPPIANSLVEHSAKAAAARIVSARRAKVARAKISNEQAVEALVHALAEAGIDPQSLSPEEIQAALAMIQGGGQGGPPGGGMGGPPSDDAGGPPDEGAYDEEEKSASLLARLRKIAEGGSLTSVGENTPESAASSDQHAELDQKNRPQGEYVVGQGKTELNSPSEGRSEKIEPAPDAPKTEPDTTASRETKSAALAAEREYVEAFKKVAAAYTHKLPARMPQDAKVAHLQTLMSLPPSAREHYLARLR